MRQNFMAGLQGGELQDRVFTSSLTGGGGGGGYNNYGLSSSCQEGVNQNTALLATAAAIAVGAGVIYRVVTLQQGRRKKREVREVEDKETGLMEMVMRGVKKYCTVIFSSTKTCQIVFTHEDF